MKTKGIFAWTIGAAFLLAAIVGITGATGQKPAKNLTGGKQWLAAMDTDHDGTVSKEEFTAYMQAQFDKADPDHDGTLDVNELEKLRESLSISAKH